MLTILDKITERKKHLKITVTGVSELSGCSSNSVDRLHVPVNFGFSPGVDFFLYLS